MWYSWAPPSSFLFKCYFYDIYFEFQAEPFRPFFFGGGVRGTFDQGRSMGFARTNPWRISDPLPTNFMLEYQLFSHLAFNESYHSGPKENVHVSNWRLSTILLTIVLPQFKLKSHCCQLLLSQIELTRQRAWRHRKVWTWYQRRRRCRRTGWPD